MWHHLLIDYVQYLNFFPQRAPRMMWLLGAGASVSSGLPTAGTLIWDLERQIYCNANRISASRFQDLDDPSFQNEVQAYFASQPGTPELWANDEYSYYFERYLPDESDRHRFLKGRPARNATITRPSLPCGINGLAKNTHRMDYEF